MNVHFATILFIISCFFTSCDLSKKPKFIIKNEDFSGKWYFQSSPVAGYEFETDSTFSFWEDEDYQNGTWLLKDTIILFNNANSAWSEKFNFLGKDTLYLGKDLFTKTFIPVKEETLSEKILGNWYVVRDNFQINFTFNEDQTYFQRFNNRGVTGSWKLKKDTLILDDFGKYGSSISIKNDTLFWEESLYFRTLVE